MVMQPIPKKIVAYLAARLLISATAPALRTVLSATVTLPGWGCNGIVGRTV
jgi:hypothetical protein